MPSSRVTSIPRAHAPDRSRTCILFLAPHLLCPHQESNLDPELRSLLFYPLNYEGAEGAGYPLSYRGDIKNFQLSITELSHSESEDEEEGIFFDFNLTFFLLVDNIVQC